LRYDNDWRDGIRQVQIDLEAGRYDPEWQRQAAEAMEERAAGKFDGYKEEHFEEWWGQKQKLSSDALAGNSTKMKLDVLVKVGLFRVGDVWSYARGFGKAKGDRVLVEKDVTVSHAAEQKLETADSGCSGRRDRERSSGVFHSSGTIQVCFDEQRRRRGHRSGGRAAGTVDEDTRGGWAGKESPKWQCVERLSV